MSEAATRRPLIAHVVCRLAMGGLENGLINLINRMPDRYRHSIICLDGETDFKRRIQVSDVDIVSAKVALGRNVDGHFRLFQLLRKIRPDVLHTRNIATIEANISAALLAVPARIHGEHGRDSYDPDGSNRKYRMLRRIVAPAIHKVVAVSCDLASWVARDVGIDKKRIVTIRNGVDTGHFCPADRSARSILRQSLGYREADFVIGFVGRFEAIKDPLNLIKGFVTFTKDRPSHRDSTRLVMIGDGALHSQCIETLRDAGLSDAAYLPGALADIPNIMRAFNVFVLPSQGEGLSNTILEAMASGLPVVATDVGGNRELVQQSRTGFLVPASDPVALANAIERYLEDPGLAPRHGATARARIEAEFSIDRMVTSYTHLYDSLLGLTAV